MAPGDTQIDFVQPPGFVTPAGRHGLRIKVAKPAIVLPNLLVGRNMQTSFSPTFTGRSPDPAALPPLTFTSSDASRLVFSVASGDLGSGSATVRHATTSSYPPSSTVYAPVWVQALDGPADIPVTASLAGYDDVSTVVQVVPTALSFATPYGSPAISTNTQADPVTATINVAPVQQGSTEGMFLRAGLDTFAVPVASSNPAIAAAVRNPLLNALTASAQFQVKPLAPGETTLTLSPPPGFVAAPPSLGGSLKVTVDGPSLVISDVTLGRDLQVQLPLSVKTGSSVAPADLDVTLTSSDGSRLLISAAANSPGAASLTLHIGASQSILSQVYLQALDDRGTVTVQISAPGYRTTTATVTLAPTTFAANSSPLNLQLSGGPYSVQVRGVPAPASGTPELLYGLLDIYIPCRPDAIQYRCPCSRRLRRRRDARAPQRLRRHGRHDAVGNRERRRRYQSRLRRASALSCSAIHPHLGARRTTELVQRRTGRQRSAVERRPERRQ